MALVDGLPAPEPLRQVPPWDARTDPEQDPVDHHPVVTPAAASTPGLWQMRRQSRPLFVGQIAPPPAGVMAFMAQGGSTMGEELAWAELLLSFALMAAVPTVIGGTLILSLVGLTMWVTAPLRRRRRSRSADS